MYDDKLNFIILSNIIFEPSLVPLLEQTFARSVKAYSIPYGEHMESLYHINLSNADLVIIWLDLEVLTTNIMNLFFSKSITDQEIIENICNLCLLLYKLIKSKTKSKILWFLFEDYHIKLFSVIGNIPLLNGLIDKINIKIMDTFLENSNITFIDLKHLIAKVGISNSYDFKGKYRWNAPYSKALIETAVKEIHKQYLIEKGITKKCLVLDCDNVLWGGIISEDGIENIKLGTSGFGRKYQDFQRFVLMLYYHGVILAICSKNNLSNIMTMFHDHTEMIIKEEYIACFQVNWENKPQNIERIAETLNIDLGSIVFVDDTINEIEAVKSLLPEVTAIRYDLDTIYEELSCFNMNSIINLIDIEKRNKTYQTNPFRISLKSQYDNYADFIKALDTKLEIHEALPIEFYRISELSQRTNKCTNGKRYSLSEIKERVGCTTKKLYSLSISDRFSDLGLVGAFEIDCNTLTFFCLSCRALGREVEKRILEFITDKYIILRIDFKSTSKNIEFKELLLETFPNAIISNCPIVSDE